MPRAGSCSALGCPVHQVRRHPLEVGQKVGLGHGHKPRGSDRRGHVSTPGVALGLTDREWCVPPPEHRVAARAFVLGRALADLNEECGEMFPSLVKVRRIEVPKHRITGDAFVETGDETLEPYAAADLLIEGARVHRSRVPRPAAGALRSEHEDR